MELMRQFSTVATYRSRLQQRKKELRRQVEELETEERMLNHLLELIAEVEKRIAESNGGPKEKRGLPDGNKKVRSVKALPSKRQRLTPSKKEED